MSFSQRRPLRHPSEPHASPTSCPARQRFPPSSLAHWSPYSHSVSAQSAPNPASRLQMAFGASYTQVRPSAQLYLHGSPSPGCRSGGNGSTTHAPHSAESIEHTSPSAQDPARGVVGFRPKLRSRPHDCPSPAVPTKMRLHTGPPPHPCSANSLKHAAAATSSKRSAPASTRVHREESQSRSKSCGGHASWGDLRWHRCSHSHFARACSAHWARILLRPASSEGVLTQPANTTNAHPHLMCDPSAP